MIVLVYHLYRDIAPSMCVATFRPLYTADSRQATGCKQL